MLLQRRFATQTPAIEPGFDNNRFFSLCSSKRRFDRRNAVSWKQCVRSSFFRPIVFVRQILLFANLLCEPGCCSSCCRWACWPAGLAGLAGLPGLPGASLLPRKNKNGEKAFIGRHASLSFFSPDKQSQRVCSRQQRDRLSSSSCPFSFSLSLSHTYTHSHAHTRTLRDMC